MSIARHVHVCIDYIGGRRVRAKSFQDTYAPLTSMTRIMGDTLGSIDY